MTRDLRSYRLIYRHARNFGVGHGCAVEWTADEGDPSRAVSVGTTFVPRYELQLAESNPRINESSLGMRFFSEGPQSGVTTALAELCDGYSDWIESTAGQAQSEFAGEPELEETAGRHIRAAREAVDRMRTGVELLRTHARAWEAFRLANAAMPRAACSRGVDSRRCAAAGSYEGRQPSLEALPDRIHPHVPGRHREPGNDGDS